MITAKAQDYYEFLQISPNADGDTIHRVYRFLASRFHPDNPESGNAEKFRTLKEAYDVLSSPERRTQYDIERELETANISPMSTKVDFMDNLEGELNRRLAVLAVLYFRRRTTPYAPEVSLSEIEKRMGFPRDYLDFTTWYLTRTGYITKADNSDFTLTAEGVDFIETQRVNIPVLNRLLTNGNEVSEPAAAPGPTDPAAAVQALESPGSRLIVLPDMTVIQDRRVNTQDRRSGGIDRRVDRVDRRCGN